MEISVRGTQILEYLKDFLREERLREVDKMKLTHCKKCDSYLYSENCSCKKFQFYHEYFNSRPESDDDWEEIFALDEDHAVRRIMEMIFEDDGYQNETEVIEFKGMGKFRAYGEYSINYFCHEIEDELD